MPRRTGHKPLAFAHDRRNAGAAGGRRGGRKDPRNAVVERHPRAEGLRFLPTGRPEAAAPAPICIRLHMDSWRALHGATDSCFGS